MAGVNVRLTQFENGSKDSSLVHDGLSLEERWYQVFKRGFIDAANIHLLVSEPSDAQMRWDFHWYWNSAESAPLSEGRCRAHAKRCAARWARQNPDMVSHYFWNHFDKDSSNAALFVKCLAAAAVLYWLLTLPR